MEMHRNIERTARFGLGAKIDTSFIDLLELLRKAIYTPVNKKIILLEEASDKIDSSRFFLQLLWEAHLVSNKQYISLETDIEDLGRIVGGWKKRLISKTSAVKAEERKY
ncbi:MAG: four helix bundle protein [Candidatus Nealsonbacteria bacterium]|nr:four helix bundle protein [Candidatus Nealsonbacteria bacterium]